MRWAAMRWPAASQSYELIPLGPGPTLGDRDLRLHAWAGMAAQGRQERHPLDRDMTATLETRWAEPRPRSGASQSCTDRIRAS
jgi:hypothetical protein